MESSTDNLVLIKLLLGGIIGGALGGPPGVVLGALIALMLPYPKKQQLVLVVSATQAEFLNSLQDKGAIDKSDGEQLYEITKYLWLGDDTKFDQTRTDINNQYQVLEGKESAYDICLVYMELKQSDKRFERDVNQLDRYDAFRNLANLAANLTVSPRLQMEAYAEFEVYNR